MFPFEQIKRAFHAHRRPGIDASFMQLAGNAAYYWLPTKFEVPPPRSIYWTINSVCNLRCRMCDVGTFNEQGTFFKTLRIDRKLHEIGIDVFKRTVDEVASYRPLMAINGTEPTLYKPLAEAVAYCSEKDVRSAVTTGGYKLPELAVDLARAGLNRLNVSIDGPADVHNAIRGRPDSFERSCEGIRLFRAESERLGRKPSILIAFTITNLNYFALERFVAEMERLPVDRLNFSYMWVISDRMAEEQNELFGDRYPVSASCLSEDADPRRVDVDQLDAQIRAVRGHEKVSFTPEPFDRAKLKRYFHDLETPLAAGARCMASWFALQILADGSAVVYTRCHNKPLGNINRQSLAEIWNGPAMQAWRSFIRTEGVMPMCRRCDAAF